jgi:D-serine dehydratase
VSGRLPEYLGDGVYADWDGYHIWLRLGAHDNPEGIALEPSVFAALQRYQTRITKEVERMDAAAEESELEP